MVIGLNLSDVTLIAEDGGRLAWDVAQSLDQAIAWSELSLRGLLGSGGGCSVWRATLRGETVAVKTVREDLPHGERAAQDLANEASLLREMAPHRNVLRALGAGTREDGSPFVVLEPLACELAVEMRPLLNDGSVSVCELWRQRRRWPLRRALSCGLQLAQAAVSQPLVSLRNVQLAAPSVDS